MLKLKDTLSQYWLTIQNNLFPWLKEELGDATEKQLLLITVLEVIRLEEHIPSYFGLPGRPVRSRIAITRAFIAKAIYDMATTRILLDRLKCDPALRRICGWEKINDIPSESTFSRAFAEFSKSQLPERVHEALIKKNYQEQGQIVGHISRDGTEIEAREKPVQSAKKEAKIKDESSIKQGCLEKGEEAVKKPTNSESKVVEHVSKDAFDIEVHEKPVPEVKKEVEDESSIKQGCPGKDEEAVPTNLELQIDVLRSTIKIESHEKPVKKIKEKTKIEDKPKRKRGRPKKGEEVVKEPTRLERFGSMTLEEMLGDLPKECDIGCKKNSIRGKSFCAQKLLPRIGHTETWIGYKLHIDTADGQVPISCILTSASTHDSQVAIPLAETSNGRVTNLYDLMDSAYDASAIKNKSLELGHVPIIDINPRRDKAFQCELQAEKKRLDLLNFESPEQVRYRSMRASERVNGRLKDEFGGRNIRVRGHTKIFCHLMFGILVVTADQLMRLAT
jgi:hypothetical protein